MSLSGITATSPVMTADGWVESALELRHHLDVMRIAKLVDRRDGRELIAATDQDAGVARESVGVAGDRDDGLDTALLASSRACASAPWRGGSNTTASNAFSSIGTSGRRNRSRAVASTGFSPDASVCAARSSALIAPASLSNGGDPRALGEAKRKGADAGEQVGDALGIADVFVHQPRQRLLRPRRLPAGRRRAAAAHARVRPSSSAARAARPIRRGGSAARACSSSTSRASARHALRRERHRSRARRYPCRHRSR